MCKPCRIIWADDGAVGICHETYRIEAGEYELVYNDVSPRGLGATDGTALVAATGRRKSAAGRLEGTDDPQPEQSGT